MPTDHRSGRVRAFALAIAIAALAAPSGGTAVLGAQPVVVDPDPPAPEPEPVPGIEPTVEPAPGATAPDGVPLGPRPAASTTRPSDLPAPGDPALPLSRTPRGSCASAHTITTGDGSMQLALAGNGAVTGIREGGSCLSRLGYSGGFSARLAGGQPNMLANASFESVSGSTITSWGRSGSGTTPVTSTAESKYGSRSVKISRSTTGTSATLYQVVRVAPDTNYVLTGWFKSVNVLPTSAATTNPVVSKDISPLEIRATVKDSGSHILPGDFRAYGYTNSADWNFQTVGFRTPSNGYWVHIALRMASGSGTGYFDQLWLSRLMAPGTLGVASTVTKPTSGPNAGKLVQTGTVNGQPQLKIDAVYEANANHIRIDGALRTTGTTSASDRGVQVTFNLPLDATGWVWADYARRSRQIVANARYEFDNHQLVPTSRYPWATVYRSSSAVSIGSPLSEPRGFTTRYDTRQGLTITFDLAVSPSATKLGKKAPFSILLFTSDPNWGFRGATKKYYAIQPTSFVRPYRANREGIPYIVAGQGGSGLQVIDPPGGVDQSKDFGLGMNLVGMGYAGDWGIPYVRWGDRRNVSAVAYTHLWGDFRPRCPNDPGNGCANKTYQQFIASVQHDAATAGPRIRDEAKAALRNAARDYNGRLRYDLSSDRREYRIFLNSDPDLVSSPDWEYVIKKYMLNAGLKMAADNDAKLEGFYVDSTSGFRQWGAVDDYDRAKWAKANSPLTFSYSSGRVAQKTYYNNYEAVRRVRNWLRDRNLYLALDYNAQELTEGGFLGADLPDWFLIENGLPDRDYPDWGVTTDSYALLKRSMAAQRPLGSVDEHGCTGSIPLNGTWSGHDSLRFRVQQSLFYGIYAGPCRWETSSWYTSTHRSIYKLFSPLFSRLGRSGWEPITNARSSNTGVWLERFGSLRDGDLNLTLRNESSSSRTTTLTIYVDNVYDQPVGTLNALKATLQYQNANYSSGTFTMRGVAFHTGNGSIDLNPSKTIATMTVTVPAYTTGVLRVEQP